MVILMKTTIRDIARLAGVSMATVSRVINHTKPVNDDIRRRVLEAMRQTGYRLEMLGEGAERSLIGFIAPAFTQTVVSELVTGIGSVLPLHGYELLIGLTDGSVESELHYLDRFRGIGAHGILFVGSQFGPPHQERLADSGIACVLAGQVSDVPGVPSVHVDNLMASYEAVTWLIQHGHSDIAMIRVGGGMGVGDERYRGFIQAMEAAGLPVRPEWIAESHHSTEDGAAAMRRILEHGRPTAVFCATDWMAIGAMNELLDRGLAVPGDVSVFGFDGSYMSTIVRPKLSTVDYSATEMGMTAARTLIRLIKGGSVDPLHANVTHYLAIRGSAK